MWFLGCSAWLPGHYCAFAVVFRVVAVALLVLVKDVLQKRTNGLKVCHHDSF